MKRDAIKQETLTPPESVSYFVYRADLAREARHTAWWRAFAIALAAVMIAAAMSADIPAITLILKSACARWLTRPRTMPPA